MKASTVVALAALLLASARAGAELPYPSPPPCTPPEDCVEPGEFHRYLFLPATDPLTLPGDFGSDNWKYTSERTGEPEIDNNPQELFGVKGASVDRAWQVTTGRPDVIIAVLDSGIRWAEPVRDLVNKFYLNRAELPVPQASTNASDPYDANGDGLFNMLDYGGDTRVSDQNGNGLADPEDLIFLFSDGVDDDGNGYIDDISGWDFFEDDNDALDEVRYGHGTGESEDSGAEANNGAGAVGTCPNCMLLEVRVGDSFIADVNRFAQGVLFAVDSGARVVQEALGTLNHSSFGQEAIDYAFERGVVVIASAADEESNHNNYPANYNYTIEVNSVTRFAELAGSQQTPRSYLYLNGCTNYGGHIIVSVPSSSCSSEATGLSSGMAGLVFSAALNEIARGNLTPYPQDGGALASFPLSANEVKQILTVTADDINFDARPDLDPPLPQNYGTVAPFPGVLGSSRFPSIAGWDQYFGYGRINADSAVRRVRAGKIPPEAALRAPAWFSVLDPDMGRVSLQGRVAANRSGSFTYTVAVAPGVQPREEQFVTVSESAPRTAALAGEIAQIDLAQVAALLPHGASGPPVLDNGSGRGDSERFTFTVRVQVTDDAGNRGEDRRTLFLHDDPDLVDGYPRPLGSDGASSPLTADVDGDGREEIVFATSDGTVHAMRLDGSEVPGWPVTTDPIEIHAGAAAFRSGAVAVPHGAVLGAVSAGDLDRDGTLEVVAADLEGKLYVWNADGTRRSGFPVSTLPEYSNTRRSERNLETAEGRVPDLTNRHDRDNRLARGIGAGPALGNLDGSSDGTLEIVAGALDRHVYVWDHHGQPMPGWPLLLKDPEKVLEVDPATDEVTMRPDARAALGTKIVAPPSLGDLDGDGKLEVIAVVNEEYEEPANALFTNIFINLYIAAGAVSPGNTRVYAIRPEGARSGGAGLARGWNPAAFLPGWPVRTALINTETLPAVGTGSDGPVALADVDGDGRPEIATGSAFGPLYLFDAAGESRLGTHASGEARTFASDIFGRLANSADSPAYGAFGGPVLAELAGRGNGFRLIAPIAGLGKLIDNNLPARQSPADNLLGVWSLDGSFAAAFPRMLNDLQFFGAAAVADIDGDGLPEALEGSGVWDLHAFNINGQEPTGWPKLTGGWMASTAAVGDLDGDGRLEVVAVTREGNLFVWRTPAGECSFLPWRRYHHDEWGSGNYATDARPPASARLLSSDAEGNVGHFTIAGRPGDDLFCGAPAALDLRYAEQPIADETAFAAATPIVPRGIAHNPAAPRDRAVITVESAAFRGRTLHFAMVAQDDAGNRSRRIDLGALSFAGATPTPTRSTAPTATITATPRLTAAPTASAAPSATRDHGGGGGGGCTIAPDGDLALWPWLALPFAATLRRRRRRR